MMEHTNKNQAAGTDKSSSPQFRWGVRFSPHLLVFLLTLLAAVPPLRGVIVSGVHWWWSDTYTQVEYIMDEARPNAGSPYIAGHLSGSSDQHNILGMIQGESMSVKNHPQEIFVPGKTILIWHSPKAPNFVVFGTEINDIPVAALPKRPGFVSLILYLIWLYVTFISGFHYMAVVARRWSGTYGNLPMGRRSRRFRS